MSPGFIKHTVLFPPFLVSSTAFSETDFTSLTFVTAHLFAWVLKLSCTVYLSFVNCCHPCAVYILYLQHHIVSTAR